MEQDATRIMLLGGFKDSDIRSIYCDKTRYTKLWKFDIRIDRENYRIKGLANGN